MTITPLKRKWQEKMLAQKPRIRKIQNFTEKRKRKRDSCSTEDVTWSFRRKGYGNMRTVPRACKESQKDIWGNSQHLGGRMLLEQEEFSKYQKNSLVKSTCLLRAARICIAGDWRIRSRFQESISEVEIDAISTRAKSSSSKAEEGSISSRTTTSPSEPAEAMDLSRLVSS